MRRTWDILSLDASVRLGEMTKAITPAKGNQHTAKVVVDCNSGVTEQKTKEEVTEELGFSLKQVERFETLADNSAARLYGNYPHIVGASVLDSP